jgi:dTDP-4-dehydrorhamnose reductase
VTEILVLGATGMLGSAILRSLNPSFDVVGTVRGRPDVYEVHPILGSTRLLGNVAAEDIGSVEAVLASARPQLVVNCIGAVKQSPAGQNPVSAITINTLFPHQLAALCQREGCRLIHISTDCVFSGTRGNYRETDAADAPDLYGRSKLLGEPSGSGCLTIRSSLIGREIRTPFGLVEWFLANRGGAVRGYTRAIFSGVTTAEMARIVARIWTEASDLEGLWHVAAAPIDKCTLLTLLDTAFATQTAIEPDDSVVCDRSLDGTAFRRRLRYAPPAWETMIAELAAGPSFVNC